MEALSTLATQTEDLRVEYEVLLPYDLKTITDERRKQVLAGLQGVDRHDVQAGYWEQNLSADDAAFLL